jgi:hypothetical protein
VTKFNVSGGEDEIEREREMSDKRRRGEVESTVWAASGVLGSENSTVRLIESVSVEGIAVVCTI